MPLAELARRLGVSLRQARRLWAEPRADYEGRSLSRLKPWAAAGVSRSTWYRRRARAKAAMQRQDEGQRVPDPPDGG